MDDAAAVHHNPTCPPLLNSSRETSLLLGGGSAGVDELSVVVDDALDVALLLEELDGAAASEPLTFMRSMRTDCEMSL